MEGDVVLEKNRRVNANMRARGCRETERVDLGGRQRHVTWWRFWWDRDGWENEERERKRGKKGGGGLGRESERKRGAEWESERRATSALGVVARKRETIEKARVCVET